MIKENKILISVVIPAYNEKKNISACLDSFKKQTFPSLFYEVIVVDNDSNDKTAEIAKKLEAKVFLETKRGTVFAIKKGFEKAQGEIVALTDADTVVNKDWLKNIYQAFENNPKLVLVGGRTFFRPKVFLSVMAQEIFNLANSLLGFNGANGAIKKDIYQKVHGIDEEINLSWETDLSLRAKKEGQTDFLFHNWVITSSRHFQRWHGVVYCLKGIANTFGVVFLKRTFFFHFGEVR